MITRFAPKMIVGLAPEHYGNRIRHILPYPTEERGWEELYALLKPHMTGTESWNPSRILEKVA